MFNTWNKRINKIWLDLLESKEKLYEGRVYWKEWSKMKIGDTIIFTDEFGRSLAFKIYNIIYANNIDTLYNILGNKLVPYLLTEDNIKISNPTKEAVQKEYEKLFNLSYEKINAYGVIGLYLRQI
jgi:ASC-1-like (ASCH) protein